MGVSEKLTSIDARMATTLVMPNCSPGGLTYSWTTTFGSFDFPGGQTPTLTMPDVMAPRTVTVELTVSGSGYSAPSVTQPDFVLNPAPVPAIAAAPPSPPLPAALAFI